MSSQHLCRENSNLLTPNTPDRKRGKKFPCKPAFEIEQPSCYCLLLVVNFWATRRPGRLRGRGKQTGATLITKPFSFFIRHKNSKVPHTIPCRKTR